MSLPPKPFPPGLNGRTLTLMAIIYAVPASTMTAKLDDEFNYGMAGLGAISYLVVEGVSLIREAHRSYVQPRDDEDYRVDYEFVPYAMKALSGIVLFGLAFGKVDIALKAVKIGEVFGQRLKLVFSNSV
jgi:hypothetical protein